MTTLANFKATLKTAWEAVTPAADGTASTYNFVDNFIEERGAGQHRNLIFRMADTASTASQAPNQDQWTLDLELFIHRNDRTYAAWVNAVEAESTDLILIYSGITAWGSGVLEAELDGRDFEELEPDRPAGGGGIPRGRVARVIYHFNVLTQES